MTSGLQSQRQTKIAKPTALLLHIITLTHKMITSACHFLGCRSLSQKCWSLVSWYTPHLEKGHTVFPE